MEDKIAAFKAHVTEQAAKPEFTHHRWFTKWHLEVVERLALELLAHYPQANRDLVLVMVWLHDYGKTLDFENQYQLTLSAGLDVLQQLGFSEEFARQAVDYIETLDKKLEVDLHDAPIEIQIVSTADGCSHLVGPFMHALWNYETDPLFKGLTLDELMEKNRKKAEKDWQYKIILPEARAAFEPRYRFLLEQAGIFPDQFFPTDR